MSSRVWKLVIALCIMGCAFQAKTDTTQAVSSTTNQPLYPIPNFDRYGVENGLSQITIYDFAEDKQGFIWMSTQRGVDRFDGYSFVHIGKGPDTKGLPGSSVFDLETDPQNGSIYAATIGGLGVINSQSMSVKHVPLVDQHGYQHQITRCLFLSKDNTLWVGTENSLFYKKLGSQRFEAIDAKGIKLRNVHRITEDASGNLWLGTSEGIWVWDGEVLSQKLKDTINYEIQSLTIDSKENLWLATLNRGVLKLDITHHASPVIVSSLSSNNSSIDGLVYDIKEMANGELWVASAKGLSAVISNEVTADLTAGLLENQNAASLRVHRLFQNKAGLIFVGTWSYGAFVYDPDSVKFQRFVVGSNSDTFSVARGPNNSMLFSNHQGLWKIDQHDNVIGPYTLKASERTGTTNIIKHIAYDAKRDKIWLTGSVGLSFLDNSQPFIQQTSYKDVRGYSVKVDKYRDLVWFGSYADGAFLINPDTLETIHHWSMPLVINFYQFNEDEIWLVTIRGLYRINTKNFHIQHFVNDPNNPNSISHNVVTSIAQLNDNEYLVTTQAGGTNKLTIDDATSEVSFEQVFENTKLGSISVGGILKDQNNNLWMSTTEGIVQVNQETGEVFEYDEKNGAFDSGYYISAFATDDEGYFYFTGVEGISRFNPQDIKLSEWVPPIYITDVKVMDKPYPNLSLPYTDKDESTATIELPHDFLFLSFEFVALDYSNPSSNQYAYRLIGLNDQWQSVNPNSREANFTRLEPGTYTLEIKATNKDGVWSDQNLSIKIQVTPPWWRTRIATFFITMTLLIMLFSFYRWRIHSLHNRSAMLSRLVEDRTRELEDAIEKLTVLSSTDPLTGLFNRRSFTDKAEQEMSRYKRRHIPFTLVLLDIDHFKKINDTYGHDCGDKILKQVANVLQNHKREQDIVSRWGGEEFIFLLPETTLSQAIHFVSGLMKHIRTKTFVGTSQNINLSVTMGLAEISEASESLSQCIKLADNRMYEGKQSGRDTYIPRSR